MERRKVLVTAALLSILLSLPLVLGSRLIDITPFRSGDPVTPLSSSTPSVFLDPAMNVTDYEDPDHNVTIGSTVTFRINISDVADLYTWHAKLSWDSDILNGSLITYGDFLSSGTVSPNGTSSGVANITSIFNDDGYGWVAESVLGDYIGVGNVTYNSGTLLEIEFEIVGYGYSSINVSVSGALPTTLLDSTGGNMTYDRQLVPIFPSDGYFRNAIPGDMTDDSLVGVGPPDGDVDGFDLGIFSDSFGASVGQPRYYHLGDLTDDSLVGVGPPDGDIDGFDLGVFSDNFGRP